ncbi:RAB3A interacting protein, partial [Coemansia sp. RSA 2611]
MANSRPTNGTPTSSPETNGSSHSSARRAAGSPESPIVQGLDTLYDKLSSASLSLKSLSPMLPSEGSPQPAPEAASATRAEDPRNDASRSALAIDSGASSPKDASGGSGAANQKLEARSPNECDPGCVCRQVLLAASPGACGICGGRPGTLAKLNDDRSRALEDLDIATQRINELAHEKARHVDYIADLEMRVAEQAKKIDQQRDVIAGLKNDLSAMNDKFVDQVNMTAEIAHSRELVEAELEDLTQKLFTEANTM